MSSNLFGIIEASTAELLPLFLNFFPKVGSRDYSQSRRTYSAQVDMIVCEAWSVLAANFEDDHVLTVEDINLGIREAARALSENHRFSPSEIESAKGEVFDTVYGEGPLGPLYEDTRVTDVIVKGPNEIVCIMGSKLVSTQIRFRSNLEYEYFLRKRLPEGWNGEWYEAILKDSWKSRFTAFKTNSGPRLCIRIPRLRGFQMTDFLRNKTLPPSVALWISELIAQGEANILVVGPPRSGKTSLLQTFIELLDESELVCIIEHLPEIGESGLGRDSLTLDSLKSGSSDDAIFELGRIAACCPGGRVVVGDLQRAKGSEIFSAARTLGYQGNLASMLAGNAKMAVDTYVSNFLESSGSGVENALQSVDVVVELDFFESVPRLSGIYELKRDEGADYSLLPLVRFKGFVKTGLTWEICTTTSKWLDRLAADGCYLEPGRFLQLAAEPDTDSADKGSE